MARRTFASFVLALLIAAPVAARAMDQTPPPTPPPAAPPVAAPQAPAEPRKDPKAYEVGPGDRLSIVIYGEDGLAKEFIVGVDGTINYPYIGDTKVSGLSLRQIQEEIRKRLTDGSYFSNPQVVAAVLEFRSQNVQVQGQVNSPGDISLRGDEMTLSKALAKASLTALAGSYVEVRRRKPGVASDVMGPEAFDVQRVERTDLDTLKVDPRLQDGDQVFVPKAPQFFLNGFVKQVGPQVWTPGMTVGRAIAAAGGLSERGTMSGLKIKRLVDGKYKEYKADENTLVKEDDQIIVKQRKW